ncbi:hypothetical protein LSAT2_022782 [Lamellibrachia satsuma]|nr:hypothetical protein LSAT2_022782 [Lamellibrachia satsuma]
MFYRPDDSDVYGEAPVGYDDDEMLERELYETDSRYMVSALLDDGIRTSPIPIRHQEKEAEDLVAVNSSPARSEEDEEVTQKHDPQFSSSNYVHTTPPSILSVHAAGIKTPPKSVTTKTPEKTVTTTTSGTVAKKGRMDQAPQPMELLMLEDIFQVLLDILDETHVCRALAAPRKDFDHLIIAEWRSIAKVADRICLIVFALMNIVFFVVVLLAPVETTNT